MKIQKATRSQVRQHNLQLILRAVHGGLANNRAALAQETGLTKPTVSVLISELMDEGLLIETGRGKSAETGGKRPRLLEFVPVARQVIGLSISEHGVHGLLTDLNGSILAEHILRYEEPPEAFNVNDVIGVINGLVAQLDAPLLCIGVGVSGTEEDGSIRFTQHLGWQPFTLAAYLSDTYAVPIYIENNTALTAIAQFAFEASSQASSLATLLINSTVEIGYVLGDTDYYSGRNIGWLRLDADEPTLDDLISWKAIKDHVCKLKEQFPDSILPDNARYLDIRYGVSRGDEAALILHEYLETTLARIFAWIITLLKPDHLSLAGGIADLGEHLLTHVQARTGHFIPRRYVENTQFSLLTDTHLDALGAVAYALQQDLGIIQWQDKSA